MQKESVGNKQDKSVVLDPPKKKAKPGCIRIFKWDVWWVWIVVALLIIFGLASYMYITFKRHKRKGIERVRMMKEIEADNIPKCRIVIIRKASSSPTISNHQKAAAREVALDNLSTNLIFVLPKKQSKRCDPIKPEDEWRGFAGSKWISKKMELLLNADDDGAKAIRRILKRHPNDSEEFIDSISIDDHKDVVTLNDVERSRGNWSQASGVMDIYTMMNMRRMCGKFGVSQISDLDTFMIGKSSTSTSETQFDNDYDRLIRRRDDQYDETIWW